MLVILNSYKESSLVKVFNYLLSCLVSVHARIVADNLSIIFASSVITLMIGRSWRCAHLKVVGVMGRGYLNDAGTEFHVNIVVGNNGDLSVLPEGG